MRKSFSEQKVKEYQDTIKKLENRNSEIDKQVSDDQRWITEKEAEQKVRLARIERNLQEKWQTEGQLKQIKEWLETEEQEA